MVGYIFVVKSVHLEVELNCLFGKILLHQNVQEAARPEEGFYIRTGVTVICKNSIIKAGTVI
jgi:glucose-1-phosphate adenylyltransferase